MANRLMLTLLALLTGLVAQTGPAQARACVAGSAEIGAVVTSASAIRQASVAAISASPTLRRIGLIRHGSALALPLRVMAAPGFLPGIDRAHE